MKNSRITKKHILVLAGAVAAGSFLGLNTAHGSTFTWVGSSSSTDWNTTANWNALPTSTNSLLFTSANASTSNTLTNTLTTSAFTIPTITFNAGAPVYIMTGNTFTLTGGITNNSSNLETFSNTGGVDAGGLPNNILTFVVNNGGGNITITNGLINTAQSNQTLTVSGAGGLLTLGGWTLENNGATGRQDIINGNGNIAITGAVANGTGTGSTLTYSGSGTLTLSGTNTYTGITTITSGTVVGAQTSGTPLGTAAVTVGNATLSLAPTGSGSNVALTGGTAASGTLFTYNGDATLALNKGSQTSLTYTFGDGGAALARATSGTLILTESAAGTLGSATGERFIINGTAPAKNSVNANLVNLPIVVQTSPTDSTGDFVTYGATNGFASTAANYTTVSGTVTTTVAGAIWDVTSNSGVGTTTAALGAVRVGNGVTLNLGSSTLTVGNAAANLAQFILNGGSITGGTLALGASEGTVYVSSAGGTISSNITGSGALTPFGPGTLTLSGTNNTYSGATNLTGTVAPTTNSAFGSGAGKIALNNATISTSSATGALTFANPLQFFGGTTNTITGTNAITFNGGWAAPNGNFVITLTNNTPLLTISGTATNSNYNLTFNGTGNTTISANIAGTGPMTDGIPASSILTLSGNSTFSGGLTVNAGSILALGSSSNMPVTSGPVGTATLVLSPGNTAGTPTTVEAVTGAQTIYNAVTLGGGSAAAGQFAIAGTQNVTFGGLVTNSNGNGVAVAINNPLTTFSGGIAINTTASMTINGTGNVTISSAMTGSKNFTYSGTGTLILSGANTNTGLMTLNSGIVNLGIAQNGAISGPLGDDTAAGAVVLGGATLQYSAANNTDYSSRFPASTTYKIDVNGQAVTFATALTSSGGILTLTDTVGSGSLTLTAANTYTGATNVNAGNLILNRTSGSVLGGTIVTVGNASAFGNATLKVAGNNAMGTTTAGSITLLGGDGTTTSQGTLSFVDGAINSLTITNRTSAANNFFVGGATAGAASMLDFEIGSSTGSNDSIALGTGKLVLNAGGGIINLTALTSFAAGNYNLLTYGAKSGTGAFTFDGTNTTETIGADTLTLTTGATSTVLNISIASPAIAYFQGATDANWSTNVAGVVNFTSDAAGTTNVGALPGSQTNVHFYASNATLTSGVVVSNVDTNFTINSLTFDNGSAPVNITAGGGTLTINAGTFGTNTSPNGITIASGAGAVSIAAPITLGASQTWTNSSANQLVVSGIVSGVGNQLTTAGNIQLGGINTYSGGTSISSGTLQMNANSTSAGNGGLGSINNGLTVNGNLDLNATSQGVGTLSGTGTILNSASPTVSTLTLGNNNATGATFSGVIEDNAGTGGTVALVKTGSGTQTLSGPNTYTGGTTVSGGTLTGTTTSLQGDILNNANVTFDQSFDGAYSGNMTGSGTLTKLSAGNLTLSGTNSYAGPTTITGGTLTGTTTSLQGNIADNAALVFDQAITGGYTGILSGSGTLAKNGVGSVTLSGTAANTNGGLTTVNNGILVLGKTGDTSGNGIGHHAIGGNLTIAGGTVQLGGSGGDEISDAATVTVNSGTLDLNGTTGITNPIFSNMSTYTQANLGEGIKSLQGTGGVITNTAVGTNALLSMGVGGGTSSYSGNIEDGAGTVGITTNNATTLSGTNSYSGVTNVVFGTLTAGTDSALGNTSSLNIGTGSNTGGGVDLNGHAIAVGALTSSVTLGRTVTNGTLPYLVNSGGFVAFDGGTLTVGSANTDTAFAGNLVGTVSSTAGAGKLVKVGSGILTLSGTGNNYTGTTTIQDGTLALSAANTLANSSMIIVGDTEANSGAKLDVTAAGLALGAAQSLTGHGTVVGNITAAAGTTFTPGGSIGTLTISGNDDLSAGGNVFNYTLGASSGSVIAVSGALTLNSTADTYTLNLIDNAGANGQGSLGAGSYTLFTYGSESDFAANAFNVVSGLPAGDTYSVINDTINDQIDLVISSPVPEPASLALVGLGAAALLRRRRRA